MTPEEVKKLKARARYLQRRCDYLWSTTSLVRDGEGRIGYRTTADASRERRRQIAAQELAEIRKVIGYE